MSNKLGSTSDGKAPTFFIPASYKGHQAAKPTIAASTTASIPSNHVTSGTRRLEAGQSTDSSGLLSSNNTATNASSHVIVNPSVSTNQPARLGSKPGDPQQSSYLLASPSGVLDLSLYNYVPAPTKSAPNKAVNGKSENGTVTAGNIDSVVIEEHAETADLIDGEVAVVSKEKKRRRFRRPRRNSKLDKLIRLLEDKRVGDDDENAEELEDLQMPRLRKVLNIIFVTLGVCFLLAVIIVIMYTTIATDNETLSEVCLHRGKQAEPCDNQTISNENHSQVGTNDSGQFPIVTDHPNIDTVVTPLVPLNPHFSEPGTNSYPNMPPPSFPDLHNPPDVSISGYQTINEPQREAQRSESYTHPESNRYPTVYDTRPRDRPPFSWSNQRYSVDLNSGTIQEQLDTQNQWWPSSYNSQPQYD